MPKTATHAIRFALRPHLAEGDIEQVGLFVKRSAPYPEIAKKQHGHITAVEVRDVVGKDIWQNYFTFSFVRNPWDRFVSKYFFYYRDNPGMISRWREGMPKVLASSRERDRLLMKQQATFLCDEAGQCMVDYVGRYESLADNFKEISATIGIPEQTLDELNASRHEAYPNNYDDRLKEAVRKWYSDDVELFDYRFKNRAANKSSS